MVGSGPHYEESMGSQHQEQFLNLKRRRDREVSIHTTHTSRSQSRSGSHVSHGENTRNMQLEIDHLRRKLRRKQCKRTLSSLKPSSNDDNDDTIGLDQGLLPVSLIHAIRTAITSREAKAHPTGV